MEGNKLEGCMPVLYGNPVTCCCSGETTSGAERAFFGSTNGMIYESDVGTSFDGEPIEWRLVFAYNNMRSPQTKKRFRKLALEVTGTSYAQFNVGYSLGYADPEIPQPGTTALETEFNAATWDSFTWDAFFWDGRTLAPSRLPLEGTAENIAYAITGSSDKYQPFTVTGAVTHYSFRNRVR
jgi:hypothetical protein